MIIYRYFITFMIVSMVCSSELNAQDDPFIRDFLQRWEGSKQYMLALGEAMPEEGYAFKPVEEEMSFAEQLMHVALVIEWHTFSRFDGQDTPFRANDYLAEGRTKADILRILANEFDKATALIREFDIDRMEETNDYGSFIRTRRQFLMLLADHVSHHRGQLVVYLRMQGIKPPNYIDYQ